MISIAMASYNGAKYIREQIDSILTQTIQDFELIICDDCSTDNTWEMLQEYAKTDSRIRIYRNVENLGYKRNFEKALSLASGEFIALSDQDDVWLPNHLEVLVNNIKDYSVVCGNAEIVDGVGCSLGMKLDHQESLDYVASDNLALALTLFFYRNPFQGASMMVRKDFLSIALPIPVGAMFHDSWLVFLSCFCGGLKYIPIEISQYRMHGNNVTSHFRRKPKFRSWINHIHNSKSFSDRVCVIDNILERIPNLNEKEAVFLFKARELFNGKKTVLGRLRKAAFELKNYRLVFSCDSKHWL